MENFPNNNDNHYNVIRYPKRNPPKNNNNKQSIKSNNKEKKELDIIKTHKLPQYIFAQQNPLTVIYLNFKTRSMKARTKITTNNIETYHQQH